VTVLFVNICLCSVSAFGQIDDFPKIVFSRLLLTNLPVSNLRHHSRQVRQHYRLYTIHSIPALRVLDMVKIKQAEREKAERLAKSVAGAALESDIKTEARKTFVPGEGRSAEESFATSFTPEQKEQIRQFVVSAKSPEEIEQIESSVQRGVFPSYLLPTVTPPHSIRGDDGKSGKKRPAAEKEENKGTKQSRVEDK